MKKIRQLFKSKTNRVAAIVFLIICIIMTVMCSMYFLQLQSTIKGESYEYLQEISRQVSSNVSRNLEDNFAVLGTIGNVLKNAKVDNFNEVLPVILSQQRFWDYKNLLLIDENGNALDSNGGSTVLSDNTYVQEAVINKTRAISPSQLINGAECIIFVEPVDGLVIDDKNILALAATYELSSFDQILSLSAFSGNGYAHIIEDDGTSVIRTSSVQADLAGFNILNSLKSAKFADGLTIDTLKNKLRDGKAGAATYELNNRKIYMVYSPLEMDGWHLMGFVPVDVVSGKSNLLIQMTLILCATVTISFALLIAYVILSNSRHKRRLEKIAYVDPITGGHTIQRFYEIASGLITSSNPPQYALAFLNIEKFKLLNEEFGRITCDEILICLHDGIKNGLNSDESIGRIAADNFCILIEYTDKENLEARFEEWITSAIDIRQSKGGIWLSPIITFGVYVISNTSMAIPQMIDRAKLALREPTTELHSKFHYAMYDDGIHHRLLREKHLEDMMETSLKGGEFEVYLQPKYYAVSETIGGAEALVRWNSVSDGMIFPDEFISLFEKNGFIVQLDLWVFEQVCKAIRSWIDANKEPMVISVNCSRVNLRNPAMLSNYVNVCEACNIPTKFIEIELTENIVFEDVEHLSKTINAIHDAGFGCSMDDFGSGYSSLNLIQDIPVDTIKLDKVFFRKSTSEMNRTESVVGSIINMSRSLNMQTVAEGVEEREQVDMLKNLGCDLIQGYYFARPMPIPKFEELAFGSEIIKKAFN